MDPTKLLYMKKVRNQQYVHLLEKKTRLDWHHLTNQSTYSDGYYLAQLPDGYAIVLVEGSEAFAAKIPAGYSTPAHITMAGLADASTCNQGDLLRILSEQYQLRNNIKSTRGIVRVRRMGAGAYMFYAKNRDNGIYIVGAYHINGGSRFREALNWVRERELSIRASRAKRSRQAVVIIPSGVVAKMQALV